MARAEIAGRGLSDVKLIEADALNPGLDKNSFDIVHARLMLITVPERKQLLSEMLSLAHAGGTIVLEDVDPVSYLCQPPHASWDVLLSAIQTAFHAQGGNAFVGRLLPELLREAGARDIKTKAHVDLVGPGEFRRTHLFSLLDSLRDAVVAQGLLSETELGDPRQALGRHLEDPDTVVIDKLFIQAWGQK